MAQKSKLLYPIVALLATQGCTPLVAQGAAPPATEGNLLRGDPSFEVGLEGWQANSAPWRTPFLATSFFDQRVAGLAEPEVTTKFAWHGQHSLELVQPLSKDFRTYVVGAPVALPKGSSYEFSAMARCESSVRVRMRAISEQEAKDIDSSAYDQTTYVGREWKRITLGIPSGGGTRIFPAIDVLTPGRCWFDALSLTAADNQTPGAYRSPDSVTLSIAPAAQGAKTGKNLFLAKAGDDSVAVNFQVQLYRHDGADAPLSLKVELYAPEHAAPVQVPVPTSTVSVPLNSLQTLSIPVSLPATGIWKLRASLQPGNGGRALTAEAAVATMRPNQKPVDPFFGTQQKWDPMVDLMGFGAIRDMRILEWGVIQPEPGRWVMPNPSETKKIAEFVAKGGTYLATLVGESPTKHDYFAKAWGKTAFGQMPLWAGGQRETLNDDYKRIFRMPDAGALDAYVSGIVEKMPYLSLEVMNEPLYYMQSADYLEVLRTAYTAAKRVNPKVTVVAFANPPDWFYLPDGARAKWKGIQPYRWHEEAFRLGAANYLDAVSLHTYDRTFKAETPENGYAGAGQAAWAMGFRRFLKPDQGVWISEKGISSPAWLDMFKVEADRGYHQKVTSPITQARWIVRSQLDALGKGLEHFYLWNRAWSQSAHERFLPTSDMAFTLFEADGSPRPALIAQRVLMEQLSNARRIRGGGSRPGLRYELFEQSGSAVKTAVIWRFGRSEQEELAGAPLAIPCPKAFINVQALDMYGVSQTACENGQLRLGYSPLYLTPRSAADAKPLEEWLNRL